MDKYLAQINFYRMMMTMSYFVFPVMAFGWIGVGLDVIFIIGLIIFPPRLTLTAMSLISGVVLIGVLGTYLNFVGCVPVFVAIIYWVITLVLMQTTGD